jgi:hypothetical protein
VAGIELPVWLVAILVLAAVAPRLLKELIERKL